MPRPYGSVTFQNAPPAHELGEVAEIYLHGTCVAPISLPMSAVDGSLYAAPSPPALGSVAYAKAKEVQGHGKGLVSDFRFQSHVLPQFHTNMLSDQFWQTAVAKYGAKSLNPPRLWQSSRVCLFQKDSECGETHLRLSELSEGFPFNMARTAPWVNELYRSDLERLILDLVDRGTMFSELRGREHIDLFRQWQHTPYGFVSVRNNVPEFNYWYRRKDQKRCWSIAVKLTMFQYHLGDDKASAAWFAGPDDEDSMVFYNALGYLMMAVTPVGEGTDLRAWNVRETEEMRVGMGGAEVVANHHALNRRDLIQSAINMTARLKDMKPSFVPGPLMRVLTEAVRDVTRQFNNGIPDEDWLCWRWSDEFPTYVQPTELVGTRMGGSGERGKGKAGSRHHFGTAGRLLTQDPEQVPTWGLGGWGKGRRSCVQEDWYDGVFTLEENHEGGGPLGLERWAKVSREEETSPTTQTLISAAATMQGKTRREAPAFLDGLAKDYELGTRIKTVWGNFFRPEEEMNHVRALQTAQEMRATKASKPMVYAPWTEKGVLGVIPSGEDKAGQECKWYIAAANPPDYLWRAWVSEDKNKEKWQWTPTTITRPLPVLANSILGPHPAYDVVVEDPAAQRWSNWGVAPLETGRLWTDQVHALAGAYKTTSAEPSPRQTASDAHVREELQTAFNLDGRVTVVQAVLPTQPKAGGGEGGFGQRSSGLTPEAPSSNVLGSFNHLKERLGRAHLSARPHVAITPQSSSLAFLRATSVTGPKHLRGNSAQMPSENVSDMSWQTLVAQVSQAGGQTPPKSPGGAFPGPSHRPNSRVDDAQGSQVVRPRGNSLSRTTLVRDAFPLHHGQGRGANGGHYREDDNGDDNNDDGFNIGSYILNARMARLSSRRRKASAADQDLVPARFWSIGEIGSHRSLEDVWVIAKAKGMPLQVYDITAAIRECGFTKQDFPPPFIRYTEEGRLYRPHEAPPDLADIIHKLAIPVGFLAHLFTREELRECNGTNGAPYWVQIGDYAFDVGRGRPPQFTAAEWMTLVSQAGGNPTQLLRGLGVNVESVKARLAGHRVGITSIPPRRDASLHGDVGLDWFTDRDVAWHRYPGEGMWVTIDDEVYDIEQYCDFHPGGIGVLRQWAGRDATAKFFSTHGGAEQGRLLLAKWRRLNIGRVTEEVRRPDIGKHEIALEGLVLDLSEERIRHEHEKDLLRAIRREHGGTDVTNLVNPLAVWDERSQDGICTKGRGPDKRLDQLLDHDLVNRLVSGKLGPEFQTYFTQRDMDAHGMPEERGECNGRRHRVPGGAGTELGKSVWCSVDGIIYDITGKQVQEELV